MLFFLIILGIIITLLVLILIFMLSTIKIKIENLRIGNIKTNKNYKVEISINIFNKLKIFRINLNSKKIRKISTSKRLEKIDFTKVKNNIPMNKETLKVIKLVNPRLEKLKLYILLGTQDAVLTSYLVAIIAGIIGIILPHILDDINNCEYRVKPLYKGLNQFSMDFDSIISVKIVNIIYIIYILFMKGRDKNERTSNRRSYDYSYGQY